MPVVLDIGGEGKHPQAWNLNPSRIKTIGPDAGEQIPRLICGRSDAIPFADASVSRIVVERTPLRESAIFEISRVIQPRGVIVLRHVPIPGRNRHGLAIQLLGGRFSQKTIRNSNGPLLETVIEISDTVTATVTV